jgi:hypothetical protein
MYLNHKRIEVGDLQPIVWQMESVCVGFLTGKKLYSVNKKAQSNPSCLGCYAMQVGSWLQTFQDNLGVPYSSWPTSNVCHVTSQKSKGTNYTAAEVCYLRGNDQLAVWYDSDSEDSSHKMTLTSETQAVFTVSLQTFFYNMQILWAQVIKKCFQPQMKFPYSVWGNAIYEK